MTDADLAVAALVELKLTARGLKGYTPAAGSHWANVLDLLGQVTVHTQSRDLAVSELRMTTVGYDYFVKKGATPGPGSHWGKALAYIAEIGDTLKVTLSVPAGTLSGTVTVGASVSPANQASTVTSVLFFVDDVLLATDYTAPYSFSWNSAEVTDGQHQLRAKAWYSGKYVENKLSVTTYNTVTPPPPPPPQAVPASTTAPTISGTATEGQTLTISAGVWTNSPTSYTRQWLRCDAAGANAVSIPGATGTMYTLVAADAGGTIRCAVIAYNAIGPSPQVITAQTAVVAALAPAVPVIVTAPLLSGSSVQGTTLSVSNGAWTNNPTSYTYQWQRCNSSGASCVNISGQTANAYVLVTADVGVTVRCAVKAVNASGTSTASNSAVTGIVASAPPPAPPPPTPPTWTSSIANGDTIATGTTWTVTVTPAPDSVEFWYTDSSSRSTLLKTDTTSPYSVALDLPAGNYTIGPCAWHGTVRTCFQDFRSITVTSTSPPISSTAYFIEDWATGTAVSARWDNFYSYTSPGYFGTPLSTTPDGRVAVVNDPAGSTKKCVRVEMRDSDPDWAAVAGISKSEISSDATKTWNGSFAFGAVRWFEWDIFLPYNSTEKFEWPHGGSQPYYSMFGFHPAGPTGWSAIHLGWEAYQFANSYGDSYLDRNVNLNFRVEGGTFNNGGPNPNDRTYNLLPLTDGSANRVLANHNRWIHLVWGMKFNYDNTGWFEVWVDGVNTVPRVNRPTSWDIDGQNYFKYGLYTRSDATFPQTGRSVAYYGRTTIGLNKP